MIKFILCVEDRFGISFNKRLIGRDKFIDEYLLNKLKDGKVFVDKNYYNYINNDGFKIIEKENMDKYMNSDENIMIFCTSKESLDYIDKSDEIVIYYWNRAYPADVFLDYNKIERDYDLVDKSEDIMGSTHCLRKEVWRLKDGKEKKI